MITEVLIEVVKMLHFPPSKAMPVECEGKTMSVLHSSSMVVEIFHYKPKMPTCCWR